MGINGLWKVLENNQRQYVSITDCVTTLHETLGRQPSIGVDIRPLMGGCVAGSYLHHKTNPMAGTAGLTIFFYKLVSFLKAGGHYVFVFDGPQRPTVKRGRKVVSTTPSWDEGVRELIAAFGFLIHNAPGEAEAELAMMNKAGVIDAIISSDGDAWVYGATTLLRPRPSRVTGKPHEYSIIYQREVEQKGLTQAALLLFALLSGGDYNDGFPGCGLDFSLALAKQQLSCTLLTLVEEDNSWDDGSTIHAWRESLCRELTKNETGLLPCRSPARAKKIPTNFLPKAVVDLYMHPIVSDPTSDPIRALSVMLLLGTCGPDVQSIAKAAKTHLRQSQDAMKKSFHRLVWPAVCLHMLQSPSILFDTSNNTFSVSSLQSQLVAARRVDAHFVLTMSTAGFVQVSGSRLEGELAANVKVELSLARYGQIVHSAKNAIEAAVNEVSSGGGRKRRGPTLAAKDKRKSSSETQPNERAVEHTAKETEIIDLTDL